MYTDTERLDFMVTHDLFIKINWGVYEVWQRYPWGEDEKWTPYRSISYTSRDALDVVMKAYQERNGDLK
jgi:hypothetical protein